MFCSSVIDCARQQKSLSWMEPLRSYLLFFWPGFLPLGAPVGTYFGFASPGAFFGRPRGFPEDKKHSETWNKDSCRAKYLMCNSNLWARRTSLAPCPSPPCTSGAPSPSSSSPSLWCCLSKGWEQTPVSGWRGCTTTLASPAGARRAPGGRHQY